MNIMELSEREILALQYSLLEELKQKHADNIITGTIEASKMSIDQFLNNQYKKERRSEKTNARCTPTAREIVDNSDYSYGDAIEYFAYVLKEEEKIHSFTPHCINKELFIDSSKKEITRESKKYRRFKESVLKRDGVCQCCGSNEDLEVHHPMPFNQYNSIGADTSNGIALCKECHSKYHSEYGYKKNANATTLAQFLRDYGVTPQTSLDKSKISEERVLKTIIQYNEDYGECTIKELLEYFEEVNIDANDAKYKLKKLMQVGKIYEPSKGVIQVVT